MQKPIFHSLGSNYSLSFAVLALRQLFGSSAVATSKLKEKLENRYEGEAFLFYKGRDAIEFSLRYFGIGEGDEVITQAFTCFAIEEAIRRAGARPLYVDLAKNQLNPSVQTLQHALKLATKPKAVLIQHTLGYPAAIKQIAEWARAQKLILIEDVAQAFGASDDDGVELGTYADVVICSFGRDKIIDAVSGGAAIIKTRYVKKSLLNKLHAQPGIFHVHGRVPFRIVARDMVYPFFTWLIRRTHQWILGKLIFRLGRALRILTSPIASPTSQTTLMPAADAALALSQLRNLAKQLEHRRALAQIYAPLLKNVEVKKIDGPKSLEIEQSTNLRFPITVSDPLKLVHAFAHEHIYLSDRWYRAPVDSGSLHEKSMYLTGSCPNAEALAQHMFNLPTHMEVTAEDAQQIVKIVEKNL